MIQSFPRWPALVFATAALAFTSSGALAQASITLSDPNCLDFTLSGPVGARTLTCVQSTTPLCTVSGPTAGTLGTPITLVATCVPQATSWAWTGGNCAGVATQNCQDSSSGYTNNQQVTYKVTGTNVQGPGPQSNGQVVTWSNTVVAKPSGCTIVQSNPSGGLPVGGGNPTLTASCSGVGAVASWSWAGGFAQGASSAIVTGSVTSTTQFTATATNGGGSTATNYTVTVATGGGGGGSGPISCTGFSATHVIDIAWPTVSTQALVYTVNVGGFGPTDAVVVRFTTPANIPGGTGKGTIQAVEFGDGPSPRIGSLSAQPCEFGFGLGVQGFANTNAPWIQFVLPGSIKPGAKLAANTQYFFNMINVPGTCSSSCNVQITFVKPSGS